MGEDVVFTHSRGIEMKRKLTANELRAYRELAAAARRLRKAQEKARQGKQTQRGSKGVGHAK